jgi:hypothetical protein
MVCSLSPKTRSVALHDYNTEIWLTVQELNTFLEELDGKLKEAE